MRPDYRTLVRGSTFLAGGRRPGNHGWGKRPMLPCGDVSGETAAARREALARQVRLDSAAKRLTIIVVEVREHGGSWSLGVPELPGVDARATRRQDIEPA